MKRRKIFFLGLAAIACFASLLLSCSKPPAVPLRVGTNTWPGYEPLYLAQELGFYGEEAIQIVNYPSSTEVSRAYRNGELEVAALTLDEALLLKQTEPDVSAFLITDISDGADVVLAKPEISKLQDLKGKRIGVETTALGAYVLTRALEKAGFSAKDVDLVPLGASEHKQAYMQGEIDAVVTFEPLRSELIKAGANVLFDSRQIPNEIVDVLVTHSDILQSRSDALKALVDGWFRALDRIQQNPQDSIRRMATREGTTPEIFAASLQLLRIPNQTETQNLLNGSNPSLKQGVQQLANVMLEQDLLQQKVETSEILTDAIVKTVQ